MPSLRFVIWWRGSLLWDIAGHLERPLGSCVMVGWQDGMSCEGRECEVSLGVLALFFDDRGMVSGDYQDRLEIAGGGSAWGSLCSTAG